MKRKQAKTTKTAKPAKPAKAAAATKATTITLAKGATADGRRGLMGKMVEAVAKSKGLSRDDLAKRFKSAGRVKVMKNVQWGVRHDVFAEK